MERCQYLVVLLLLPEPMPAQQAVSNLSPLWSGCKSKACHWLDRDAAPTLQATAAYSPSWVPRDHRVLVLLQVLVRHNRQVAFHSQVVELHSQEEERHSQEEERHRRLEVVRHRAGNEDRRQEVVHPWVHMLQVVLRSLAEGLHNLEEELHSQEEGLRSRKEVDLHIHGVVDSHILDEVRLEQAVHHSLRILRILRHLSTRWLLCFCCFSYPIRTQI